MHTRLFAILALSVGLWAQRTDAAVGPHMQGTWDANLIHGVLEDHDGAPLAAVEVDLAGWDGPLLGSAMTDPGGRFEFSVDNNGPFELRVHQGMRTVAVQLRMNDPAGVVVQLPAEGLPATPVRASSAERNTVSVNDLEAPAKARARLNDANKAIAKADLNHAWELVNEAIAAAPGWGRPYFVRGLMNYDRQNIAAAEADFNTAIRADPNNVEALSAMGKLYTASGRYDLADRCLRQALTLPPAIWQTYFELARLDLLRGQDAEAEKMAQASLLATPPAPIEAHYEEATAADNLHDWSTAAREYRIFISGAAAGTAGLEQARARLAVVQSHLPE